MKTPGYGAATALLLGLFALVWAASYYGWGLRASAATQADRATVRSHSARVGGRLVSGGPHFGK